MANPSLVGAVLLIVTLLNAACDKGEEPSGSLPNAAIADHPQVQDVSAAISPAADSTQKPFQATALAPIPPEIPMMDRPFASPLFLPCLPNPVYGQLCGGGGGARSSRIDLCPDDPAKTTPGQCGCGVLESSVDSDGDQIFDCVDNCIDTPNNTQENADQDNAGEACDCDDNNALIQGATGTSFYVGPTGDDTNNCLSPAQPCMTIAKAISVAEGGDTIHLLAGTYFENNLGVTKNLNFFGAGADVSIVNGLIPRQPNRVFVIVGDATGTFCKLTVTGGLNKENGGGISVFEKGNALVTSSTITANEAFQGGGIHSAINSDLKIFNSKIIRNGVAENGGGVVSFGTLTIVNTLVAENNALGGGDQLVGNIGGIATFGTATITNSVIEKNKATNFGGGLGVGPGATATVSESKISENTSSFGGGTVNAGMLTITKSTVTLNIASGFGGGVGTLGGNNLGKTFIIESTISNNVATKDSGGGIGNNGETTVTNSTVSGNSAQNFGGGLYNYDNSLAILKINNTTVTNNTAKQGAGLANDDSNIGQAGTVEVFHTIVANQALGPDCYGDLTSLNHNLQSGTICDFTGVNDVANQNPLLAPLANNGGPTETHALGVTSPAINAGAATCNVDIDQRGLKRPVGLCDIGSFENQ